MKKHIFIIIGILTLIATLVLTSCEDSLFNCIRGNGIRASETRIISGNFDGIELDGSFEVYFTQDSITELIVEADENLLPYISTAVRGHNLIIDNTERCFRTVEPVSVFVSAPYLYEVQLDGSGYIQCDYLNTNDIRFELDGSGEIDFLNVFADYIEVDLGGSGKIELKGIDAHFIEADLSGSGKIELWGIAIETDLDISGSGQIRAFHLEQDRCNANISGSGSIYVFVYDFLDVEIPGSGAVFYEGFPEIRSRITGTGRIVDHNKK